MPANCRDLVPFVQFKKPEKHPHGGMSVSVKFQVYFTKSNILPRFFYVFWIVQMLPKSCNALIWKLTKSDKVILDTVLCKQHS